MLYSIDETRLSVVFVKNSTRRALKSIRIGKRETPRDVWKRNEKEKIIKYFQDRKPVSMGNQKLKLLLSLAMVIWKPIGHICPVPFKCHGHLP